MHFCARSLVAESVTQPYDYYANNVAGTLNLLQAMQRHAVRQLVFSSSAAVFGQPQTERIDEDHPKQPINPYGASKLMVERMLADAADAYGLRSVSLRYFNAAGASMDGSTGESHEPETHLIPNVLRAAGGDGPRLRFSGLTTRPAMEPAFAIMCMWKISPTHMSWPWRFLAATRAHTHSTSATEKAFRCWK